MRWWLSLTVFCMSTSFCLGAGVATDARARLQSAFPGVQLYSDGAHLTRIYGVPFGYGLSAEQSADDFVQTQSGALGLTPAELVPGNTFNGVYTQPLMYEPDAGACKFTLVYYTQYRDGLPVYGADLRLLVRNTDGYPLVLAASSLRDLGDFTVPAGAALAVSEGAARAAALAAVPGLSSFTPAELVIWAGRGDTAATPRVALAFHADNGAPSNGRYEKWAFVCDAGDGQVLHQENLVLFADIVGTVSGRATVGPKADICSDEVPTPMPWATVSVQNGPTLNADASGQFTLSNFGGGAVAVTSFMSGIYFGVENAAGAEDTLVQIVNPPGPVNFMHNQTNQNEAIRAQVNGYVQANIVRSWVLVQNPSYPTIASQTNFPVRVNRTDGYCPGNAWYDGSSINFCSASGSYADTAFSNVVHHEYGHHIVATGGSGQGAYGEGMGDTVAMLIADDPVMGYGFTGQCGYGIRSAENNLHYPCSGEIHDCGQLLSGCIWNTRQQLGITHPDQALAIISDLTLNSVLLHDGDQITPQITIDFLTLDDTDGNIYNGTPHAAEICAGFGSHNMSCPPLAWLAFSYPENRPTYVRPGGASRMRVAVAPQGGQPIPHSGSFCYQIGNDPQICAMMEVVSPNVYDVVFPATPCGTVINYFVSAQTTDGALVSDPQSAPAAMYSTISGYGPLPGGGVDCTPPYAVGDLNCDGAVNFGDINPFILALGGYQGYHTVYPNCDWLNADCNNDGAVNFADINAFVARLAP